MVDVAHNGIAFFLERNNEHYDACRSHARSRHFPLDSKVLQSQLQRAEGETDRTCQKQKEGKWVCFMLKGFL